MKDFGQELVNIDSSALAVISEEKKKDGQNSFFLHIIKGNKPGSYELTKSFSVSMKLHSLIENREGFCVAIVCDGMPSEALGIDPINTFNFEKASKKVTGILNICQYAEKVCIIHGDSSVWVKHRDFAVKSRGAL